MVKKLVVGSLGLIALYLFVSNSDGTKALFGSATSGAVNFATALQARNKVS